MILADFDDFFQSRFGYLLMQTFVFSISTDDFSGFFLFFSADVSRDGPKKLHSELVLKEG